MQHYTRWQYFRWLEKCGGAHLTQHVKAKKLAPALGVALWLAFPMFIVSNIFIEQQGIWVDKNGNLYGMIAYINPQKIIIPQLQNTLERGNLKQNNQRKSRAHNGTAE